MSKGRQCLSCIVMFLLFCFLAFVLLDLVGLA